MTIDDPTRIARDPQPDSLRAGWRQALLAQRAARAHRPDNGQAASLQRRLSGAVEEALSQAGQRLSEQVMGLYWPVRAEPMLGELPQRWHDAGARLALPVVDARDQPLRFVNWAPGDPMVRGEFGIPRPAGDQTVRPTLLVIPCLGFDERGYRLGYGGGFYDRTLALLNADAMGPVIAMGVAWDEARLEGFEPLATDLPLQAVITPSRVVVGQP
jgi:5,10-methenyltetrahydrofolate synthetase